MVQILKVLYSDRLTSVCSSLNFQAEATSTWDSNILVQTIPKSLLWNRWSIVEFQTWKLQETLCNTKTNLCPFYHPWPPLQLCGVFMSTRQMYNRFRYASFFYVEVILVCVGLDFDSLHYIIVVTFVQINNHRSLLLVDKRKRQACNHPFTPQENKTTKKTVDNGEIKKHVFCTS